MRIRKNQYTHGIIVLTAVILLTVLLSSFLGYRIALPEPVQFMEGLLLFVFWMILPLVLLILSLKKFGTAAQKAVIIVDLILLALLFIFPWHFVIVG